MNASVNAPTMVGNGAFRYRVDETWDKFPAAGPQGEAVAVACDSRQRVFVFWRSSTGAGLRSRGHLADILGRRGVRAAAWHLHRAG